MPDGLDRGAFVHHGEELAREPVRRRLTTNAGGSLTSTQFFLSATPAARAVASGASPAAVAPATSASAITATGLKKWDPATRPGWARPAAISVTDRAEVSAAAVWPDGASTSAAPAA